MDHIVFVQIECNTNIIQVPFSPNIDLKFVVVRTSLSSPIISKRITQIWNVQNPYIFLITTAKHLYVWNCTHASQRNPWSHLKIWFMILPCSIHNFLNANSHFIIIRHCLVPINLSQSSYHPKSHPPNSTQTFSCSVRE